MHSELKELSKEVYNFEKKAGFDKTSSNQLIKWLEKELNNYKKAKSKKVKQNKLMDIIILAVQISRRDKVNLDSALKRWWKDSKKYLKN